MSRVWAGWRPARGALPAKRALTGMARSAASLTHLAQFLAGPRHLNIGASLPTATAPFLLVFWKNITNVIANAKLALFGLPVLFEGSEAEIQINVKSWLNVVFLFNHRIQALSQKK